MLWMLLNLLQMPKIYKKNMLMKNKTLVLIFLIIGNVIFAQNLSKEEAYDLIVSDLCKKLNEDKETFSKSKSLEKRQFELGLLLMKSINELKKDSDELSNHVSNTGLQKVGEELGVKLGMQCGDALMEAFSTDELLDMVDKKYGNDSESIDVGELELDDTILPPPPPAGINESDISIVGGLASINNDVISYLKFTDEFEKEHVFLVVNQFIGKELLSKTNYGKQFKVYYDIDDFYDLSESRYIKKKVVKYIEEID